MGYRHDSDKIQRIVSAVNSGRDKREVAAEFGVTLATAKNYCAHYGNLDIRPHKGNEPRCRCGLLLPCTCGGHGPRATDFMRQDGQPALAFVGSFRDW